MDMPALEEEAFSSAVKQVAAMLRRPDQLEKLSHYKQRALRKKLISKDVATIQKCSTQIIKELDGIPALKKKLQILHEENRKHIQCSTAIENLKAIYEIQDTVDQTYELINSGKLLHAHQNLMELENARDNVMFEVFKTKAESLYDQKILADYFCELFKLADELSKQLWYIIGRTLEAVRGTDPGPQHGCIPCFPPEYHIFDRVLFMYHTSISNRLREIAADSLEKNELIQLLSWLRIYSGKDMLGHVALGIDAQKLVADHPLLPRKTVTELMNRFIEITKNDLQDWLGRTLVQEKDVYDWYKGANPETDCYNQYYTPLASILFQMIDDQMQLGKEMGSETIPNILFVCVEEMLTFTNQYKEAFQAFYNKHFEDRSRFRYFTQTMVSIANVCLICVESSEKLKTNVRLSVQWESPQNSSTQATSPRPQSMRTDLLQNIEQLKDRWNLNSQIALGTLSAVDTICFTIEDYYQDHCHLKPSLLNNLLMELQIRVVQEYMKAFEARRLTFQNYEERKAASDQLCKEAERMKELFSRLIKQEDDSSEEFETVTSVLLAVAEVMSLRDKSLLALEVSSFVQKYPNISVEQLSGLIQMREDVGRSEARQLAQEITAQNKLRPKLQGKIANLTICLTFNLIFPKLFNLCKTFEFSSAISHFKWNTVTTSSKGYCIHLEVICATQFFIFTCIMYNGIGLQTARGSGTSGYVQKNLAHVIVSKDKQQYRNEDDIKRMESKVTRKPNKELILHERKRKIELKCLEMQDLMTEQNYPEEEIQEKVDKYRALLRKKLEEEGDVDDDEVANEKKVKDSHIMAEMMQEKNDRIRRALNIKKDHVSGAAFKFNEKKAEKAELASLNKNLLQRPLAEVEKKEEADEETTESSSASSSSSSSSSEDSDSSTDSSDSDEESSSSASTVSSDSSREVKQKTSKRVFREEPSRRDGKRSRRESSDRERSSRKARSPSPRNVSTKQRDSSSKISKSKDSESYKKRRAEKNDDDHLSKDKRKETKSGNDSKKHRHKSELSRRSMSSSPRARRHHHSKHDERNGNRKSKEEHRKESKHK
ncbi:Exocyst complex component 3 [Trichinella pseudospiralis]|uniref:Exocyst complex component 3 n=1 Tax=Trichinella pseudospiralis TaxID=6337 RepID=A0A0V1K5J3_TRIPS|nr:Exocyst complex component 3 [Trichinella pseudospiralis]